MRNRILAQQQRSSQFHQYKAKQAKEAPNTLKMTKCCLPSASTLQKQSYALKPTKTIVRHLPIVAEGWETAALGGDTFSSHEMEDIAANQAAIKAFQQALVDQKELLEPTLTVVRHTLTVTASEPAKPKPKATLEYLRPKHGWTEAHGFRGQSSWELPRQIVHCDQEARPGYASQLAHEYEDSPNVLQAKVDLLARLLEASEHCLVYTGAGISTNSGISDYATRTGTDMGNSSSSNRPKLRSPYEAQPTYAHRALVQLHNAHFLQYWVQQNHDGLPQKAGLPQHAINEIHGAWYDPSNPVVAMNGSLRSDLFTEMLEWEQKADLTLSMGTSMCGMNSDRVFTTVAHKGKNNFEHKGNVAVAAIGGVIINRQQTQFDHLSCLRIFADVDEVMAMLLQSLGMQRRAEECRNAMQQPRNFYVPQVTQGAGIEGSGAVPGMEHVFRVPYREDGTRHPANACRLLDLREGSKVQLTGGPYKGDCGEVLGQNREGHYRVQFRHLVGITKRPFESVLGSWWTEAAVRGQVDIIPVVNLPE